MPASSKSAQRGHQSSKQQAERMPYGPSMLCHTFMHVVGFAHTYIDWEFHGAVPWNRPWNAVFHTIQRTQLYRMMASLCPCLKLNPRPYMCVLCTVCTVFCSCWSKQYRSQTCMQVTDTYMIRHMNTVVPPSPWYLTSIDPQQLSLGDDFAPSASSTSPKHNHG